MTGAVRAVRRPAYYYGWNIVIACVLSQLAALGVTLNCFSLFLPSWTTEFNTPVSSLAFGVMIFSLGCSVFTIPAGLAADKFPVRRVMGLGLAGIALIHMAIGFTTAGWQIIAIYALALPAAVTFSTAVPAQAVVSRWFVRRRGLAMGLCAFGLAMAGVVFPPIITHLLPAIGWRATWWVFGGLIALVILPAVVLTLRDRPTPEEGADYFASEPHDPQVSDLPLKAVFTRPNVWVIVVVFLAVQSISMAAGVNMAPLALSRGMSLQTAGLLLSVYSISALVGKLASGLLADRFGNRMPFALLAVISAAGVAMLGFAHGAAAFMAAALLIGLSQGHWTLLASATAAEFGPRSFGRAYGVISAFTPLGSLTAPVVAKVFETTGDYSVSLYVHAAMALAGAVVVLVGLRERR